MLDLARKLLTDDKAKLIISFEWKYIPFTYPQNHPNLPSFVIIGLPASEASNALVLPTIAHELGHSLWRQSGGRRHFSLHISQAIVEKIKGPLRDDYNRIFQRQGAIADRCDDYHNLWTWQDASDYCIRQVEELFSDFVGLSLFGTSYLDAFEYLLSPALSTERDPEYPGVATRARYLETHAHRVGVTSTDGFASGFELQRSAFHPASMRHFEMTLADAGTDRLVAAVADHVASLCRTRNIRPPDDQETAAILDKFMIGVPAEGTSGLGPILNAGWAALKSPQFMVRSSDQARMRIINELVLKSIEVYEIERITGHGAKKERAGKGT